MHSVKVAMAAIIAISKVLVNHVVQATKLVGRLKNQKPLLARSISSRSVVPLSHPPSSVETAIDMAMAVKLTDRVTAIPMLQSIRVRMSCIVPKDTFTGLS